MMHGVLFSGHFTFPLSQMPRAFRDKERVLTYDPGSGALYPQTKYTPNLDTFEARLKKELPDQGIKTHVWTGTYAHKPKFFWGLLTWPTHIISDLVCIDARSTLPNATDEQKQGMDQLVAKALKRLGIRNFTHENANYENLAF